MSPLLHTYQVWQCDNENLCSPRSIAGSPQKGVIEILSSWFATCNTYQYTIPSKNLGLFQSPFPPTRNALALFIYPGLFTFCWFFKVDTNNKWFWNHESRLNIHEKYVDTVIVFAKTWSKGHWPLDDLWPPHLLRSYVWLPKDHCVQVPRKYIKVCGYSDLFCKNLKQRSLTPRWPLTPHLLRSHVWLYPRIIVSKSHENTLKYVHTVTLFAKTWTKGQWPLDDLWPHICWGLMCDSTQGSLCPSPMKIHQSMWIQWPFLQKQTWTKGYWPLDDLDPTSVEVTCVTLPKDHCVQVPLKYIKVCGYSEPFC